MCSILVLAGKGSLQYTAILCVCKGMPGEFCAGSKFTGGGTPLSWVAVYKPCVQPPPLLTRQCAKFSSFSPCLVSMTTIAQVCLCMHVHIGSSLCQPFVSQRAPHQEIWLLVSSLQQLHVQQTCWCLSVRGTSQCWLKCGQLRRVRPECTK